MLKHTDLSQRNCLSASNFLQTFVCLQISSTSNYLIQQRVLLLWLNKGRKTTHIFLIKNANALGSSMAWPKFARRAHCLTKLKWRLLTQPTWVKSLVLPFEFILRIPTTKNQSWAPTRWNVARMLSHGSVRRITTIT